MFRSSTVALLRRVAASAPKQEHHMAASLVLRSSGTAKAGAVRQQLTAPSTLLMTTRYLGTHAGGDAMPNGGVPLATGAGGRSSTSAALAELLGRELQEEKELMENEDRAPELEAVSEKIHKRFHIKETAGSRCVVLE